VIYGDTDNMGIAYNANYLRWFEIGRTELFRSLGLPYKEIEAKGIFLPVSEVYCKFLIPAKYDDLLTIETSIDLSLRGGIKFDYRLFVEENENMVASGYTKHAFVDHTGRIVRPPAFLTEIIRQNSSLE
jgi:acyl-CoA thioester hydrolase